MPQEIKKTEEAYIMENKIIVREYKAEDLPAMIRIWNEIVEDGVAFPQEDFLTMNSGAEFFAEQTYVAVAENKENADIMGLYILHPNNIGRCGHICNASYAVKSELRGKHIGESLVCNCIEKAVQIGFGILQFNAVVSSNTAALKLYKKLGFTRLGTIPGGFRNKNGEYEDIIPHYKVL